MPVPRRPLALVAVWVAGALVATATGVLAVRQVATSVGDDSPPPLSAAGVETALGSASPGAAAPTASPTTAAAPTTPATGPTTSSPAPTTSPAAPPAAPPAPPPATVSRSFSSRGGSVGVSCTGSTPELVFASPAQGWAVDHQEVEREHVEVRFVGPGEVRMRVTCGPDGPVVEVEDRGSGSDRSDD